MKDSMIMSGVPLRRKPTSQRQHAHRNPTSPSV